MDVAYYISELLGQHGEINVPGLGFFVQLRVDGYYNNTENKFYPPGSRVHFDPQYLDDDILVQHIADKKKISLASSKYFTEKYISNLRHEAMAKDTPLGDLGWMYFEGSKLRFKTAEVLEVDPAFYGYPQIELDKLGGTSIFDQIETERTANDYKYEQEPATAPPAPELKDEPIAQPEEYFIPQPAVYEPQPETNTPPTEVYTPAPTYTPQPEPEVEEDFIFQGKGYDDEDDDYRPRSYAWLWITLLVLIVLAAGGIFALYKYKPATFNRLKGIILHTPAAIPAPVKHDTIKKATTVDTTKKAVIIDTTTKTVSVPAPAQNGAPSTIDSTKVRYEVIGTSAKTIAGANKAVENYKSLGIDAHILTGQGTGPLKKVSLGTYTSRNEAEDARKKLIKSGKVRSDIYTQPINPKK